ncbi:hypothetical protein [Methylosinus trichosporium]|uniref:hypothetical protein n=1 Tax=Methylosinus TaxID=425 RepID=UPI0012DBE8AA
MRDARDKGKQLDPRSSIAAECVMLAPSLSPDALALYRLRWRIELAFDRLKSLLRLDCLPANTEKGGRSWIYAHLNAARISWTLPPEDMLAAIIRRRSGARKSSSSAYCAILGRCSPPPRPPRRKRKLQSKYPVRPYPSGYAAYPPRNRGSRFSRNAFRPSA